MSHLTACAWTGLEQMGQFATSSLSWLTVMVPLRCFSIFAGTPIDFGGIGPVLHGLSSADAVSGISPLFGVVCAGICTKGSVGVAVWSFFGVP